MMKALTYGELIFCQPEHSSIRLSSCCFLRHDKHPCPLACCKPFFQPALDGFISHVQGVNQEELLVEAKTSLIKSAEVFDVSKGARLTSFAWFRIMEALQRLCQNEGTRLPITASAARDIARLKQAETELSQQTGRSPILAEAATKVSMCFITGRHGVKSPLLMPSRLCLRTALIDFNHGVSQAGAAAHSLCEEPHNCMRRCDCQRAERSC